MQYETPEVLEIGEAANVILGFSKDGPSSDDWFPMSDLTFAVNELDS